MKCTVDKKLYMLIVPFSPYGAGCQVSGWGSYHFVKHCIMESHLGLYRECSLSEALMTDYRARLHRGLQCRLIYENPYSVTQQVCDACQALSECSHHLQAGIMAYCDYLTALIQTDAQNPRHVYYQTRSEKDNIAFINDQGVIAIVQRQGMKLVLKTGFRYSSLAHLSRQVLPNGHYLSEAKRRFREGVYRGAYVYARFVKNRNW